MSDNNGQADVLIIGAGASGSVVAWRLAQAGMKVVCLEQGGWLDKDDYPHRRNDWELQRQLEFNLDPNERMRPEDYPLNVDDTPINPLMFNAVGGSTIHWSGHFPRFKPSDFRVKTLDGVADDWPLDYWELEPYYDRNDALVGVTGLAGDPANPPRSVRSTPPLGLGPVGEACVRGFEKLGWHWWPADSALLSEPFDGRPACNNCGPCDLGCPTGAMSSAHVTYWPKAVDLGVRLVTHARVREVTLDSRGLASGALYFDENGDIQEQKASMVVLACNGVGTPRLMLNSTSSLFPDGLANSSGLVGKNLMFHPNGFVTGIFEEDLQSFRGPIGALIHCQEFYETDLARGFVRGFQLQMCRATGPLSHALGGFTSDPVPWGARHHEVLRERFSRNFTIGAMIEDLPEPHNRVTLDPELCDSDGIPAPKIEYTLSDNSEKIVAFAVERARELLEAAGAHTVLADPVVRRSGWHLMGTARMGDDPADSVVDKWGRTHDVPNLFVVDGSVFVTCAPINPTTTIQALALRTADWIADNHQEIPS
ncbi:MAG: GMC family oxidoreductase [Chloroflexi bacterium]|nr:GMC family oxidoreductase [Chloroflexota bacterium]MCY3936803.1 GMC family oxidoreductase [Chloroflexota bacterium]